MENIIPIHLLENGIVVKLDEGIYTYREPFVNILQFVDEYLSQCFAEFFNAEEHYYPVITPVKLIKAGYGDKKFGNRLLFVSHLKESLETIADFTKLVADNGGWSKDIDISDKLKKSEYVFNPLCSYHIYETVKHSNIPETGLNITSQTKCFLDYNTENNNAELRDFTIREYATFGNTDYVNTNISLFTRLFEKLLTIWGLDFKYENLGSRISYSVFVKELDKSLLVCECNLADNSLCNAFRVACEKSGSVIIHLEMLVISILQNESDINLMTNEFKKAYTIWENAFGLKKQEMYNELT